MLALSPLVTHSALTIRHSRREPEKISDSEQCSSDAADENFRLQFYISDVCDPGSTSFSFSAPPARFLVQRIEMIADNHICKMLATKPCN